MRRWMHGLLMILSPLHLAAQQVCVRIHRHNTLDAVKAARGEAGKHASRCEPQAALVAEVRLVLQQAGRAKAPAEEGEAAAAVEVAAAEAAAAEGLQVSSGAYVVNEISSD